MQHSRFTWNRYVDDQFSFCPELQMMVRNRAAVGREGKLFNGLEALSSHNNLITLRNLCLRRQPSRTLEIGLAFGGSCLVFVASHRDLGREPRGQHVAIDPYQSDVWDDCGRIATEHAYLSGYLDFRAGPSCLELPKLISEGRRIDCAYIDGSHLFEDVLVDFYFVNRLLEKGGIVLFDDSSNPHIRKVLRFVHVNMAQSFVPFDLGPFRADQGRSLKYRLASLLGCSQLTAFQKVGPSERSWDSHFTNF
jgi:cephalosporin hydroxylase